MRSLFAAFGLPFSWATGLVQQRKTGFRAVRVVLGGLLLVAALLKWQAWVSTPAALLAWPAGLTLGVVAFELAAGLWLLASPWPVTAWWVGVAAFTAFALVAGWQWLASMPTVAASDGCLPGRGIAWRSTWRR